LSQPAPITLVVLGVSGDLAGRKLLPALYWLEAAGRLPEEFRIVGAARREVTQEGLAATVRQYVGDDLEEAVLERLQARMQIVRMDSGNPDDYDGLFAALKVAEGEAEGAIRLLYLSVPPAVAGKITGAFAKVGLNDPLGVTTRLLMEKPFGSDLASAEVLADQLHAAFREDQLYRIDHYVAKTVAQNILPVRAGHMAVRDRWDAHHIERIEIDALEAIGIEGRADFYEQTGALRDLIQSHLLALMSLTMMEPLAQPGAAELHEQRQRLLAAVPALETAELNQRALRGQYEGYREEVKNPDSHTETFARLELNVGTPRWQGVPVVLTTGKGLAAKLTEIRVYFKAGSGDKAGDEQAPRCLRFRLQPDEAIELEHRDGIVETLELDYGDLAPFGSHQPDGYERVLLEAMAGDQTNFTSNDEVLATWRIVEPVLRTWLRDGEGLKLYPFGSEGSA
jgi:glucose-6-phosphate 1-dehydrogenase